jgi:pimeloyl-ACP methyl ester carboxylesterase
MRHVQSKDGTTIAYWHSGHGTPLVLIHGTSTDHQRWTPILPELEKRFAVYAIDRRGRGASGDGPDYALEREFEDVAAVLEAIGEPVFLLGHSHGAICSLEAALRTAYVRKLMLYEPPINTDGTIYPAEVLERLQASLDAGDRAGVVMTFFKEIARMPESELDHLRAAKAWPARVAAAHTLVREIRLNDLYRLDKARLARMRSPTLLLLGGDSPMFFKKAIEAVHASLPKSRIDVMPGQRHTAIDMAPELFLRSVLEFLVE